EHGTNRRSGSVDQGFHGMTCQRSERRRRHGTGRKRGQGRRPRIPEAEGDRQRQEQQLRRPKAEGWRWPGNPARRLGGGARTGRLTFRTVRAAFVLGWRRAAASLFARRLVALAALVAITLRLSLGL